MTTTQQPAAPTTYTPSAAETLATGLNTLTNDLLGSIRVAKAMADLGLGRCDHAERGLRHLPKMIEDTLAALRRELDS